MYEEYYFKEEINQITKNIDSRSSSLSRPITPTRSYAYPGLNRCNSFRSTYNSRESVTYSPPVYYEPPRVPRHSSVYLRDPTPPPIVERFVERAPTPEPDVITKIIVKPQPQRYIERIIEKPKIPPPVIIKKEVTEAAPPPIYKTKVVEVDYTPRTRHASASASASADNEIVPCPSCICCNESSYYKYSSSTERLSSKI